MVNPVQLVDESVRAAVSAAGALAEDVVARPDDPLDVRDSDYIRRTLPAFSRVTDVYFRPKVRGLENIPKKGPVLLVGNHSGGLLIADTFVFAYAFYEHFGPNRPFHQLAHDLVFAVRGLGGFLGKYGTVPASHENAERALDRGAAVLVYPGGDHETFRPSWESSEVDFDGRSGWVKLALRHNVPIVPVVAIGGQETALFLGRGRRIARGLGLDRLMRLKVFPIAIGPPYGVTILDLPGRVPLPAQISIDVLPPVDLRERFGPRPKVERAYDAITGDMQDALDRLQEERDLPLVGSLG